MEGAGCEGVTALRGVMSASGRRGLMEDEGTARAISFGAAGDIFSVLSILSIFSFRGSGCSAG